MNFYQFIFYILGHVYVVILTIRLMIWIAKGKWQRERPHTSRTPEL